MRKLNLDGSLGNVGLTIARQSLGAAIQLVIIIVIGQVIGATATGTFALATLIPALLAGLLSLGLPSANIYFVASRATTPSAAWSSTRNLCAATSLIGVAIASLIVLTSSDRLFPNLQSTYIWLGVLSFPAVLMNLVVASIFQGLEDFKSLNSVVLLQPILSLVLLGILGIAGDFAIGPILALVTTSQYLSLALGMVLLRTSVDSVLGGRADRAYLSKALSYGYRAYLGNFVALMVYRSDIFLVNYFAGPARAGVYAVAVRVVEQLSMIPKAIATVFLPKFSRMESHPDRAASVSLVGRSTFWSTSLAAIAMAAVSGFAIPVVFGAEFHDAVQTVAILLPGMVLYSVARVVATDFAARGMVQTNLNLAVATLVLATAGNLALIPRYGITGAAVATTLSYSVSLVLALVVYQRFSAMAWWRMFVIERSDAARLLRVIKGK